MPREKGPEWDYVTLVQPECTYGVKQVKNKCKLCEHAFHGGATHIRLHFLQVPGCGVTKCTASEDTWMNVLTRIKMGRGPAVMGWCWLTG
eukprot:1139071-Pelagomonas_calceolata.AAC.2